MKRSLGPVAGSRDQADAVAQRVLSRLRLPARSRLLAGPRVDPGPDPAASTSTTDIYERFSVPMSATAGLAFLHSHLPTGLVGDGHGSGWGPHQRTQYFFWAREQVLPAGIAAVELTETAQPSRAGSAVRVDVRVDWFPRRPAADYLAPRLIRSVTVHIAKFGAPVVRTWTRKITSAQAISRLLTLFNKLQVSPGTSMCPTNHVVVYRMDLRGPAGELHVQASCFAVAIDAAGRRRVVLSDPGNRMSTLLSSLTHLSRQART
ncbi:MAG: hypothetical protein ACLQFR_19855 [Streptosporangiaceae bacterium]